MARRPKPDPASQESLDGLIAKFDRFAVAMERRLAKTASQESVDAVETKLERHVAAMDRVAGELLDNRRSLIVFDSMLGDHRRRITALESRLPPSP